MERHLFIPFSGPLLGWPRIVSFSTTYDYTFTSTISITTVQIMWYSWSAGRHSTSNLIPQLPRTSL